MKLFEETHIGRLTLKNRLWRSATWLGFADENGHLTTELTERYTELAKGGVGTIITGLAVALEGGQPYPKMLGIYSDDFIPEYQEFTKLLHSYDAIVIMQIGYGGTTTSFQAEDYTIWGASSVANPDSKIIPVEMTKENINTLVVAMGKAAQRAQKAGFDGVQIHAAHGYLLSQFLSPYFNVRTDEYGGGIENRARIIFEIFDSMRKYTDKDFPIFIKMHCDDEWGTKGLSEQESLWLAKELEKRGVAGIEFSGGNIDPENKKSHIVTKLAKIENQSYFKDATTRIASELKVPVILVGGNRSTEIMEEILNNSEIDYFALSRPLHCEPDLPNIWQQNPNYKTKCISCNNCWTEQGNTCILNRG